MAQQALITLTAITPGIVPHKRVLKLNPECPTVAVGRASKSISKGLISAEENAWIDNPVMSRDHAELTLEQEDMSIVIKDVYSMHGTQINDKKLSPDIPQVVMVGDILSFGAEVRRGPEVYPPCKFRINYEFSPWTLVKPSRLNTPNIEEAIDGCLYSCGFQFPESSDIEDEENHSEEEVAIEDSQEEEETTPIETPPRKQSMLLDAIDLTSDDVESSRVSTGLKCLSSERTAIDNPPTGRSMAPIVIDGDSDEEDEDDSDMENKDLDYPESQEDSDEDSNKENNEESDDSQSEVGDACHNEYQNSEILDTESNLDTSQISAISPVSTRMFHDNKDIAVSNIRTTAGISDETVLNDEGQTGKLTDNAAWDDGLSDEDESSQDEDLVEHKSPVRVLPPLGGPVRPGNESAMCSSYVWPNTINNASTAASVLLGLSPVRTPSPSDAAMAKSQTTGVNQTTNLMQLHNLPGDEFSHFVPNRLGEKFGKQDFFEAREVNRARVNDEEFRHKEYNSTAEAIARPKFNQLGHPYNPRPSVPLVQSPISVQQQAQFQRQQLGAQKIPQENNLVQQRVFQQHEFHRQQAAQQHIAQALALAQAQQRALQAQQSVLAQSTFTQGNPSSSLSRPSTFAILSQQPPVGLDTQSSACVMRALSPEFDMTSAVKFNESKAAMAAVQSGRSALRIDDIVEPSMTESDVKSMKRKASEISDVLEEEVRVWASKDSSISAPEIVTASTLEAQTDNESQQVVGPTEGLQPSTFIDLVPAEPVHKRIKKFAEVAGYTALGGLAGGLALFATLVATAPDFL